MSRCRSKPSRSTTSKGPSSAVAAAEPAPMRDNFSFKTSSLFFGSSSLGSPESIGALAARRGTDDRDAGALPDPDMKVMASLPAAGR